MNEILVLGLSAIASLLAGYAIAYLGTAATAPRFFLDRLSFNDERFKRLGDSPVGHPTFRWTYYVATCAFFAGLLVVMYHVAGALTMWIPVSWVSVGEDGDIWRIRLSAQLLIGLFFTVVVAGSYLKGDANAHELLKPKGWRVSSWARRGYDLADQAIERDIAVRRGELEPSHFAMEFTKGHDIRLAEEGARDAEGGRYRPKDFEDRASYTEAWHAKMHDLYGKGWEHPRLADHLQAIDAERAESAARLEKQFENPMFAEFTRVLAETEGKTPPSGIVRKFRSFVLPQDWRSFQSDGFPADGIPLTHSLSRLEEARRYSILGARDLFDRVRWGAGEAIHIDDDPTDDEDKKESVSLTEFVRRLPGVVECAEELEVYSDQYASGIFGLEDILYTDDARGAVSAFLCTHLMQVANDWKMMIQSKPFRPFENIEQLVHSLAFDHELFPTGPGVAQSFENGILPCVYKNGEEFEITWLVHGFNGEIILHRTAFTKDRLARALPEQVLVEGNPEFFYPE